MNDRDGGLGVGKPTAPTGSNGHPWPEHIGGWARSIPGQQVGVLVAAGVMVQFVLPYRYDSTAHLVGGGALIFLLVSAAPSGLLSRLGAWADLGAMAVLLSVAWVTEATILGPFDPLDIAFTMAGGLVAVSTLPRLIALDRSERRSLGTCGALLMVGSLAYRYVLGIGA